MAPDPNNAFVEPPDYGDGTTPPPGAPPAQADLENPPLTTPPAATPAPQGPVPAPVVPDPSVGLPDPSLQPTPTGVPGNQPGEIPDSPAIGAPAASPASQANPNDLVQIIQSDPQLRQIIAQYYMGQVAAPPAVPSPPSAVPQYLQPPVPQPYPQPGQSQYVNPPVPQTLNPPFNPNAPAPQFQVDEYTDPNVRALVEQNARIQAQMEQIAQAQRYQSEREMQVQMRHFTQVVEGAVSQWGQQYQVPQNILADVRQVAARMGAAQTYMNGVHPITGQPVVPDPSEATKIALDIAYHSTPSAIQMEQERVRQRMAADASRRQKLGGVGGSSASVPRQQPAPTDAAGRRAAMNQEVAEMMRGEWTGSN